jgi:hypothetical protein
MSQSFYAVIGIIVCVAAASCAALFAVNDVFGEPLVCGGGWYDVSVRVATCTFSHFIAADSSKDSLKTTSSATRCSYATTTTATTAAAERVFAGSLLDRMMSEVHLSGPSAGAVKSIEGKGTRATEL